MIGCQLDIMQLDELGDYLFAEGEDASEFYLCIAQEDDGGYSAVIIENCPDGYSSEIGCKVYARHWDDIIWEARNLVEESGILEPAESGFDYGKWISDFIRTHEESGSCPVEEWDEFSDIYKDEYGIRPRMTNFNFTVI